MIKYMLQVSCFDIKIKMWFCRVFIGILLFMGICFIGSVLISEYYKKEIIKWHVIYTSQKGTPNTCKSFCRFNGSKALPEGIVTETSNFELRRLWDSPLETNPARPSKNLLALAVGLRQKEIVNNIVKKFPPRDFTVMLFHYDNAVDKWMDLEWSMGAIHVSAINQTKWWFAKRFLHPDIVADYSYIFLWDEDLGVDHFNPTRYISTVREEGLEISQPALDPARSEIHHQITKRVSNSKVHRRMYKLKGSGKCDSSSTTPPCIGWVEMMAPVFSMAAWRCVWYMIQNDLIHAWGLDRKLGYCAQGDRLKNVGIVDTEYVVHLGLPTLGVSSSTKVEKVLFKANRVAVRRQSFLEMQEFERRWRGAAMEDKCWVDPYPFSGRGLVQKNAGYRA